MKMKVGVGPIRGYFRAFLDMRKKRVDIKTGF